MVWHYRVARIRRSAWNRIRPLGTTKGKPKQMRLTIISSALLTLLGVAVFAERAQAADEDLRSAIRDEIKAYEAEKKTDKKDDNTFKVYWSNGLRFKTNDGKIMIKLGGRVMLDAWLLDDDKIDRNLNPNSTIFPSPSGTQFRRLRMYNAGEIGRHVEYVLDLDFSPQRTVFKDLYVGIKRAKEYFGFGFPNLKFGRTKEGQGLEWLGSSKYLNFMERAMMTGLFANRSTMIQAWDVFRGGQLGYQASVSLNDTADFDDGKSVDGHGDFAEGLGYTGRIWWTPWYDCNCKSRRLHLGASLSYRDGVKGMRFRARPPSNMVQRIVDTRKTPGRPLESNVDSALIFGAEMAWIYGPWKLQAEYARADVSQASTGDPSFSGWYVSGSYWLTGESSNYGDGVIKRPKPCANWLDKDSCGSGGWQLAARYEEIDLTDGAITGGEATAITLGVNWWWNPVTRVMLNYFYAETTIPGAVAGNFTGSVSGLGMRFQVDF